jgi:hypothetical protein
MERDDLALATSQDIAVGRPTPAPFALMSDIDLVRDQHIQNRLDASAVVPDNADSLREVGEELLGQPEFQGGGVIQRDDNFIDVTHLAQDVDDAFEGRSFKLCIERREDQRDWGRFGIPLQFLLKLLGVGLAKPVQDSDDAILIKIRQSTLSASLRLLLNADPA